MAASASTALGTSAERARRRVEAITAGALAALLLAWPSAAAEPPSDPSLTHGAGEVAGGLLVEFPKTVVQATLENPPVIGTAVGALAGAARALQRTVGGLVEMARGFDPWGAKKTPRR